MLLAEMARAGVRRLVLASSMVGYGEGRYECAAHGGVRPGPRAADDLAAGRFEPRCRRCGRELRPGTVTEDAAADPRNAYADTKIEMTRARGGTALLRDVFDRVPAAGR